jgi:hypothetical protein
VERVEFSSKCTRGIIDMYTRGFAVALGQTIDLQLLIGGQQDGRGTGVFATEADANAAADSGAYDYHATGFVYTTNGDERTLEASFGGLLFAVELDRGEEPASKLLQQQDASSSNVDSLALRTIHVFVK